MAIYHSIPNSQLIDWQFSIEPDSVNEWVAEQEREVNNVLLCLKPYLNNQLPSYQEPSLGIDEHFETVQQSDNHIESSVRDCLATFRNQRASFEDVIQAASKIKRLIPEAHSNMVSLSFVRTGRYPNETHDATLLLNCQSGAMVELCTYHKVSMSLLRDSNNTIEPALNERSTLSYCDRGVFFSVQNQTRTIKSSDEILHTELIEPAWEVEAQCSYDVFQLSKSVMMPVDVSPQKRKFDESFKKTPHFKFCCFIKIIKLVSQPELEKQQLGFKLLIDADQYDSDNCERFAEYRLTVVEPLWLKPEWRGRLYFTRIKPPNMTLVSFKNGMHLCASQK